MSHSYVCTASIYVDDCADPAEAALKVEQLNQNWGMEFDVQIVLPEEPSWDEVDGEEEPTFGCSEKRG